ncbi:hypothetical protein EJ04DRAFT_297019 [Polyplosphaeria fusca]|uniref:Uncharacterized protein n=1 Tax=Polyplosphaeria fusca TaxID=682080 RepID=A0A9P4UYE0_9PLEO|nr:hypothetical protein EJ04DRAFT_297019 [Polyplosphaeria fusca]
MQRSPRILVQARLLMWKESKGQESQRRQEGRNRRVEERLIGSRLKVTGSSWAGTQPRASLLASLLWYRTRTPGCHAVSLGVCQVPILSCRGGWQSYRDRLANDGQRGLRLEGLCACSRQPFAGPPICAARLGCGYVDGRAIEHLPMTIRLWCERC